MGLGASSGPGSLLKKSTSHHCSEEFEEHTDGLKNCWVKGHLLLQVGPNDSQADGLWLLNLAIYDIRLGWISRSTAFFQIEVDSDPLLWHVDSSPWIISYNLTLSRSRHTKQSCCHPRGMEKGTVSTCSEQPSSTKQPWSCLSFRHHCQYWS